MLTEEQIKNLKPGDPIVIHTTFDHVDSDGDVRFFAPYSHDAANSYDYIKLEYVSLPPSEHGTSVPTPKYDPCRPFKNGDIVRYVERDGRSYVDAPPVGATCCVCVGEDSVGMVSVEFEFSENEEPAVHDVPFYHLELVTPVEELESFGVRYSKDKNCVEVYHRRHKHTVAAFYCIGGITREQAEEHAEAERDRLNAEYRKKLNK